MALPCADGHGRPPNPEVDRRQVRPHLCTSIYVIEVLNVPNIAQRHALP